MVGQATHLLLKGPIGMSSCLEALQLSEQALHTRLLVTHRDAVGAAGPPSSGRPGLSADTPTDEGAGL